MSPKRSDAAPEALALFTNGILSYEQGLLAQQRLFDERRAGRIPDAVLLLQHRPVITLGRRGRDAGLLISREELARRGIDLFLASRGGDITYHGPGQWVLYPVLKLGSLEADARGYLFNLEEIAIRTAADFGVRAFRREGMSGAWTDSGKIAAIGFHLKRWITQHGMSFNAAVDLGGFGLIVPCGLHGEPVASLQSILGSARPELDSVRDRLAHHFQEVCGRRLIPVSGPDDLPDPIRDLGPILFGRSNPTT
ncbi:MAG: lipoyl(octanoyl) transferase LipB [Kiritimatiellia bacterium]|nr:lipoyl(octanoyl) transferase LipB [Kiritimatiellia bacterium]